MRPICLLLLSGTALAMASPASAADQLKFGAAPAWVVPQTIPPASDKAKDKPVAILLHDQQTMLEPGKISTYSELAFKIQKPEGLTAGNLSVAWNPAFDTPTVNRLEIRRGNQVIDVLKSGQTFTTMRRESNLEMAMLDGILTANIQPEGLQEGDVVVMATTTEHVDPVLKGHVEATFAPWGETQIGLAHARVSWPATLDVKIQRAGDLPSAQPVIRDGKRVLDLTMRDVEPVIDPKGAPVRFKIGRMAEATDFGSWADAARLMAPLYREAAVVSASGPLRDELEKIRKASADPKVRAEQALQLVQQRIRYVALLMGQGGYVPAPAETTWSRRFGDCKAKTALLLALLHELGIQAEPVAVNPFLGDAIGDWLPMIGAFNHVLVRAHVGGKDYWLDGTRTGDTSLDRIKVPDFGWGLPLIENAAALVHIVPPPLDVPDSETQIAIDANAGVFAPAKVTIEELFRGDTAVGFDSGYSQLSAEQKTQFLHENAKKYFDSITGDSSTVTFDKAKAELRISTMGTAKLDWKDGWYYVPSSSIGYNPDFERPAGPLHDVPFATNYPDFNKRVMTIKLPPGFAAGQKKQPPPIHETLAGVEYTRAISVAGDELKIESSARSTVPEVPYKDALAAAARLKALADDDVYLKVPGGYRPSPKDILAMLADKPASANAYFERGLALMQAWKVDEAIADYSSAIAMNPKEPWYLANRGISYVWKGDTQSAEKDIAATETLDPDNPVAARARGLLAEIRGDFRAAIDAFSKSLVRDPQSSFAYEHRASAYRSLGEYEKALADTDQLLKLSHAPSDRLLRANILVMQGKPDAAANEAELVMKENATSDYAFVIAGRIYGRLGRKADSMKAFDRALALRPQAYVYVNRAQSRPFTDYAGRLADLDAALKLEPNNAEALAEKAEQLALKSDYKTALQLYDAAVKAAPNSSGLSLGRAIMLYKAGSTSEALKLLAAARAHFKSAGEFNNLCWSKATRNVLLESALQDCQEALKLSPNNAAALDSTAFVKLRLGKTDEAIALYDQAIARNVGAASYMGRAIAYAHKGDRARAEADRAKALKLNPDEETRFAEYGLSFDPKPVAQASH